MHPDLSAPSGSIERRACPRPSGSARRLRARRQRRRLRIGGHQVVKVTPQSVRTVTAGTGTRRIRQATGRPERTAAQLRCDSGLDVRTPDSRRVRCARSPTRVEHPDQTCRRATAPSPRSRHRHRSGSPATGGLAIRAELYCPDDVAFDSGGEILGSRTVELSLGHVGTAVQELEAPVVRETCRPVPTGEWFDGIAAFLGLDAYRAPNTTRVQAFTTGTEQEVDFLVDALGLDGGEPRPRRRLRTGSPRARARATRASTVVGVDLSPEFVGSARDAGRVARRRRPRALRDRSTSASWRSPASSTR